MSASFGITSTQSVILNLIRFLCSQGVLLGHLFRFFKQEDSIVEGIASYCVLIFFVLSGFLISFSLRERSFHDERYDFFSFMKDRFFRIYPPFMGALVLVFVIDLIGFQFTGQYYSLSMYCWNFLLNSLQLQEFPVATFLNEHYMIEFFRFHYFGTNLPLWTIAIEWWLYIFYGFTVFKIFKNKKIQPLQWLTFAFLLLTPLYYLFVSARMEKGLTLFWFLGVIITFLMTDKKPQANVRLLSIFSLILILTGMYSFRVVGYNVSILIFFLGLAAFMRNGTTEWIHFNRWLKKPAEKLAGYSYSLYLIHYPILYFIFTVFSIDFNVQNFVVVFCIVNIIAYLFAAVFEKNSKKLKLYYENYRSRKYRLQEKV